MMHDNGMDVIFAKLLGVCQLRDESNTLISSRAITPAIITQL